MNIHQMKNQNSKMEVKQGEFLDLYKVIEKYKESHELLVPGFEQTFPLYLKGTFKQI